MSQLTSTAGPLLSEPEPGTQSDHCVFGVGPGELPSDRPVFGPGTILAVFPRLSPAKEHFKFRSLPRSLAAPLLRGQHDI